jgi:Bacterial regulatory protein, Fis family
MSGPGFWPGGRPPRFSPRQVAEALSRSGGNVTAAARLLRASRSTINRYVSGDASLRRIVAHQRAKQAARAGQGEEQAPPVTGRRLEPPPWGGSWVWVEVRRPAESKVYGALMAGDVCAVPGRQAQAWLASGTAVPAPEDGGEW